MNEYHDIVMYSHFKTDRLWHRLPVSALSFFVPTVSGRNIAFFGDISCGMKDIESTGDKAEEQKNYQPPRRRTGKPIKSPTDQRSNQDACDELARQFHGLSNRCGCFRSLPFLNWRLERTLSDQFGLKVAHSLIQPDGNRRLRIFARFSRARWLIGFIPAGHWRLLQRAKY